MASQEQAILTDADFQTIDVSTPAVLQDSDFAPDVQKQNAGMEAVYDDKRGQVFEVQPELSGKETEYVIGTNYDKKQHSQHYGLIDLGADFVENVLKGGAAQIVQIPESVGNLVKSVGERGAQKEVISDFTNIMSLNYPAMAGFYKQVKEIADVRAPRTAMDDSMVELGDHMIQKSREFTEKLDLKPDQKSNLSQLYFDVGSAGATVAETIGLLMLTKNPAVPAAFFGAMSKGDLFAVARSAGKSPEEAGDISSVGGIMQTGLMALGGSVFLRAATLDQVLLKTLARTGEQVAQNMLQTGADEAVKEFSGVQKSSWQEMAVRIGYSGLLGAIVGLPASYIASVGERNGVMKELVAKGVSEPTAKKVVSMISEATMNDPQVQERVSALVKDEFSPVSLTLDERLKEFKNVEKIFDEELKKAGDDTQDLEDKNIAAEKVVRGKRLNAKEIESFPDLADMQFQLESITEQIENAPNDKVRDSLQKRKDGILKQFEFPREVSANPEIEELNRKSRKLADDLENADTKEQRTLLTNELFDTQEKLIRVSQKEKPKNLDKQQVRELTGQIEKAEKTLTESQALKRSMKRQEQAAREAAQATKERINTSQKLIRAIQKAGKAKNVAAEEKVQIDALKALLTKAKTLEDLRKLHNKIQELKDTGREKVMASKEIRAERFRVQKELLLKTLGFDRNPVTQKVEIPTEPRLRANNSRNLLKGVREATMRAPRLLDALDGGQDFQGPFHQILYDAPNRAYSNEVALAGEATIRGVEIMKRNNISAHELMASLDIDGQAVTMDEAMEIYASMNNPQNRRAIIFGNGLSPEFIQKVIARLPEKFKKAADETVGELTAHFPRVNAAYMDLTDGAKELSQVEGGYIPMPREDKLVANFEEELAAEIEDRAFFRRGIADPSFVKKRMEVKGKQSAITLGLMRKYFNHVAKREHFINMQATLKEMKGLLDDREIREAIRQSGGPEMLDEIQKYVERVHNPYNYLGGDAIEKFSKVMRDRASVVHIGLNVLVAAKQLSALPLFLGEVGPWDLLAATTEMSANFGETVKFIQEKDPQMKFRNIDRDVDEFRKMNPSKADGILDKARDVSFEGVQIMDKYVALSGWLAKYNQMKRLGASETEAVEAAQKAVLRTQNASAPKDIPSIYAQSEFLNLFLQFTNQTNQIYNILTYDIPKRATTGRAKSALLGGLGVALSTAVFHVLAHGGLPDEPEDLSAAAVESMIDLIPVLGPTVNSLRKGYAGTPAAIDTTIKMLSAPATVAKDLSAGNLDKALDHAAFAVAGAFKLPYSGIRKTIMGLNDLAQGNTDDLRRLLYSEAQLKG